MLVGDVCKQGLTIGCVVMAGSLAASLLLRLGFAFMEAFFSRSLIIWLIFLFFLKLRFIAEEILALRLKILISAINLNFKEIKKVN